MLAHELGHIVTRQLAIEMTKRFRDVLGVKQVGDRADIYNKYFQYLATYRRKSEHAMSYRQEEAQQYIADQVALFAMSRAGYSPQAYVDVLDRLQQTHGKSGSWFSDLFGTTTPEQHRLRELLKNMATLPSGCAELRPGSDLASFNKWQSEVIGANSAGLKEALPGLISKTTLALPLRPDITNLRFSPDAKYVLAQDDGGIHVLARDPLHVLSFIDAPDAYKAQFSPDSQKVVFYTSSFRVETWDIAKQQRVSVHELLIRDPCLQSALSPDGRFFACLRPDFSLSLLNVSSGDTLASKRDIFEIRNYYAWFLLLVLLKKGNIELIHMRFSPDGRYFLAGSRSSTLMWDLTAGREANLPGSIRNAIQGSFAFVGSDRLVAVNPSSPNKSPVLRFPSGEKIGELPLSSTTHVDSVTHGNYVMLFPLKERPLGAMDLEKRELFIAFKHDAADLYDNWVLAEWLDGEIGISELSPLKIVSRVALNQSRLGGLQAAAVSPGFTQLAVSTRTRGGVWDLTHNIRTHLSRAFEGAWFGEDQALYAKFGKANKEDKDEQESIARLDPMGGAAPVYSIKDQFSRQAGPYLIISQPAHPTTLATDCTVELLDYRTLRKVWSRHFPREVPQVGVDGSGRLLLGWQVGDSAGRDELQKFPDLKAKAEKEDFFFEVLDPIKDAVTGKLLVKTNKSSLRVSGAITDGNWALVAASSARVLAYSLTTGEEKAHAFGQQFSLSTAAGQFAVSNGAGELDIYNLANGELVRKYDFPVSVALQSFSPDGKRLFVFTRDQTAYVLDLSANAQ